MNTNTVAALLAMISDLRVEFATCALHQCGAIRREIEAYEELLAASR